MDDANKKFVLDTINTAHAGLVDQLNKEVIVKLNAKFDYVFKRFDDANRRLGTIESRLNIVAKDTDIIPDIFGMLEKDGLDIVKLEEMMTKLEE